MAAPSQPLLPSIFSLCDLSSLDDDPSWLPLEGTLSAVSCLGFAADSMFASDLDPLSGFVAESEPVGDQLLPLRPTVHSATDPLTTASSAEAAAYEKLHLEGGELRAALLQSAGSTPASSCATVAPAAVAAAIKDEPAATAENVAVHLRVAGSVHLDPDSDDGKSTRTSTLKDGAGLVLPLGQTPAPPPRAAAVAASATVAKMAAAESAAAQDGVGAASAGWRAASGTSAASSDVGASACHSGLRAPAVAALSGESKETVARKAPAPGGAGNNKVTGKRAAPPAASGSAAGSEAENVAAKPPTRRRMASRFDAQIDPNLSAEERRRARRMLSNRESARRSRHRKETFLQSVGDQLAEMEALKAAASRAAEEAANKLAALQRKYDVVVTERDALRLEVAAMHAQAYAAAVH